MGASNSSDITIPVTDFDYFLIYYKLEKPTCQDIKQLFKFVDEELLYNILQIDKHSEFTETEFNKIDEVFQSKEISQMLRKILPEENITKSELLKVLNWIILFESEELSHIVLNSYNKGKENDEKYSLSDFGNWLDINLPDLAMNLCIYVTKLLKGKVDLTYNPLEEVKTFLLNFNSCILDVVTIYILWSSLLSIYKTAVTDHFGICQICNWVLLYSSTYHGHSNSKMREMSFEFTGTVLILIKTQDTVFCLATENGLKDDFNNYGNGDSCFMKISPIFQRYVTGSYSSSGIIYSNFSTKSGKRGIFIGHKPLASPAVEIDEDLSKISVLGLTSAIHFIEVWAVGADVTDKLNKFNDIRKWEKKEVEKHKNRKLKVDDWVDSPDREILNWGGVNVKHSDMIGQQEQKDE